MLFVVCVCLFDWLFVVCLYLLFVCLIVCLLFVLFLFVCCLFAYVGICGDQKERNSTKHEQYHKYGPNEQQHIHQPN